MMKYTLKIIYAAYCNLLLNVFYEKLSYGDGGTQRCSLRIKIPSIKCLQYSEG